MHPLPRIIHPLKSDQKRLVVEDDIFHYIKKVLRLKIGDPILVLDGEGGIYDAVIERFDKRSATLKIKGPSSEPSREPPVKIILLQAILKADKMDFVLQKCTELGVVEFWPIITERTEVKRTRKLPHWRAVVREATRQCRRAMVPHIREPMLLKEALDALSPSSMKLLLSEKTGGSGLPQKRSEEIILLAGPEGGLTEQEDKMAKDSGFIPVNLGPRVLRAETAAMSGVALVQFLYGDMNLK